MPHTDPKDNKIIKLEKENERIKKQLTKFAKDRYGLFWFDVPEGFEDDVEHKLPILKEMPKLAIKSKNDKPTHILIEGDNYHALTCLNYTHKGKVDVIYIDPPYNTGSDGFKYKDKRFLDKYPDGTEVPTDHPLRHSYWLSFMKKRLELANYLLNDTGVIFISIDENEFAQLKLLCDEVFREQNMLSIHHIQVRYGNKNLNEKKEFQELIEYTLIYAKNKKNFRANKNIEEYDLDKFNLEIKELKKPDKTLTIGGRKVDIFLAGSYSIKKYEKGDLDFFKETWLSGSIYSGTGHGLTYQRIVEKRVKEDGLSTIYKIHGLGEDGLGFRYMINPQREGSSRGKMFTKIPTEKREALENGNLTTERPVINFYDFSPDFGNIRHEGGISFNSGKKPVKMLKQLINYHKNKDAVVLDFFAGSGSTAHAVMDLNEEDGGKRQFIINTNNENKIMTDQCYPRIKNVIKGHNSTKGLGNSIKVYKTAFVGKNNILNADDRDKIEFAHNTGEMLAIAENTLEEIEKNDYFQLFESSKQYTAVYFREEFDKFNKFEKKIRELKKPVVVYIFSWEKELDFNSFEDDKNIKVKTIPQPILEIYKQIYNLA